MHTGAVIAPTATSDEHAAARERARTVIAAIGDIARQHLYEPARFSTLRNCAPAEDAACRALLSEAIYEVLAQHVEPALRAGQIDLAALVRLGPEPVHAAAIDVLEQSEDPVDRVCAVLALERAHNLPPAKLPSDAFRQLRHKPVVEAQMLLMHSDHHGLPDSDVVREVALFAGASETDPRARVAALEALAKPATAEQLGEAVRSLAASKPPDWEGWTGSVAPALGRCGISCADETVRLLTSLPDSAGLAESIVRLSRPQERDELLERLTPALPDDAPERIRRNVDL